MASRGKHTRVRPSAGSTRGDRESPDESQFSELREGIVILDRALKSIRLLGRARVLKHIQDEYRLARRARALARAGRFDRAGHAFVALANLQQVHSVLHRLDIVQSYTAAAACFDRVGDVKAGSRAIESLQRVLSQVLPDVQPSLGALPTQPPKRSRAGSARHPRKARSSE